MQRGVTISTGEFYFIFDVLFNYTNRSITGGLLPNSGCPDILRALYTIGETHLKYKCYNHAMSQ